MRDGEQSPDLSGLRPTRWGAGLLATLLALTVLWIDGVLPSAVAALRAIQIQPEQWTVEYLAAATVPADAVLIEEPPARFRAARVECRAAHDVSSIRMTHPGPGGTPADRRVRCVFSRLPFARLVLEARSVDRAEPEVFAYLARAPFPFTVDYRRPTPSLLQYTRQAKNMEDEVPVVDRLASSVGYLGSILLVSLVVFRRMRHQPEATVSHAVASLRQCWILRAFFLTVLSLPVIAWLRHALQGRFDAYFAVDWFSSEIADVVILGPITEEILYRAWMIPLLSRFMDVRLAAVISGFAFYVAHPDGFGFPGLIGTVLFTALWLRSKSLWVCILAHMGWNLAVVIRDGGIPGMFLPM